MKQTLHVLIAEDSPDDAELLKRELERGNYTVALERVETEGAFTQALTLGSWDLVLCDWTMPLFSGKSALTIARNVDADIPFIYVSGTIGEDAAVDAMRSGAHDYVLKNNLTRLVPAVDRELREAKFRRIHKAVEADRERLKVELSGALADVKYLRGLLPICASCKKIRNDRDEWQHIEVYIQQHSDAQFTHGMCPDCLKRYYDLPSVEDRLGE